MGSRIKAIWVCASVLALVAPLASCAVYKPATVNSVVVGLQTAGSVEFPIPEKSELDRKNGLRADWRSALASAFARRSITVETGRPQTAHTQDETVQARPQFVVDFGLSVHDAGTGIAKPVTTVDNVEWQSEPRHKWLLDKCRAQRLRGTLVIFRRSDGVIIYRGEAESQDCSFDDAALDDMADQLVRDAVS